LQNAQEAGDKSDRFGKNSGNISGLVAHGGSWARAGTGSSALYNRWLVAKPVVRGMADITWQPKPEEIAEYPYGPTQTAVSISASSEVNTTLRWESSVDDGGWLPIVALAFVFAIGNFASCPLMHVVRNDPWATICTFLLFGATLAQGGLLSAAIVFADASFSIRTAYCWSAGLFLAGCWAAGFLTLVATHASGWPQQWWEPVSFYALSLPLAVLAIQSPLWFARGYLGWRLTPFAMKNAPRPLSIRDYLAGTAVAAISVGCARMAAPPQWQTASFWLAWTIFFAAVAAISLLSVVPAMLLMFRSRDCRIGFCLLLLYGTVAGAITVTIILVLAGPPGGPGSAIRAAICVTTTFASLAAFLGAGMKIARDCGYTLVMGRTGRG
jgi:hypothetical protein